VKALSSSLSIAKKKKKKVNALSSSKVPDLLASL
jgi:hypothetical protein